MDSTLTRNARDVGFIPTIFPIFITPTTVTPIAMNVHGPKSVPVIISLKYIDRTKPKLTPPGDRGKFPEVRFHTLGYADGAAFFALYIL